MRYSLFSVNDHYPKFARTVPQLYQQVIHSCELAERLGYDTFFCAEHHFHEYGGLISDPPTPEQLEYARRIIPLEQDRMKTLSEITELVGFFFEATIGMIGFWFLEVGSFLYVINTLSFFVSGHMFPLDLLPAPWDSILKSLPFSYLAYFPAAVFVGKIQGEELLQGLALEAAWAVAFVVMANLLYRRGLRYYSAYGG